MNRDATRGILFVILLIVVLLSAYRVVAPFLAGLTWAAVLVATFRPLHDRLHRAFGGRERAAAAAVTLLVAAFVAVPLLAAAVQAVHGGHPPSPRCAAWLPSIPGTDIAEFGSS